MTIDILAAIHRADIEAAAWQAGLDGVPMSWLEVWPLTPATLPSCLAHTMPGARATKPADLDDAAV